MNKGLGCYLFVYIFAPELVTQGTVYNTGTVIILSVFIKTIFHYEIVKESIILVLNIDMFC